MVCDGCNYFSFWAIFCPFTSLTAQKTKIFKKMKKNPGDITILHMCTYNYDQMMYSSRDTVLERWTKRQTDGKSDIQRWVPHPKIAKASVFDTPCYGKHNIPLSWNFVCLLHVLFQR